MDGGGGGGCLDAVAGFVAVAVAALEPVEFRGAHSSPSVRWMKARDSLGVRACARIVPYRNSRIRRSLGLETGRPLNAPSQRPTAVPSANFSAGRLLSSGTRSADTPRWSSRGGARSSCAGWSSQGPVPQLVARGQPLIGGAPGLSLGYRQTGWPGGTPDRCGGSIPPRWSRRPSARATPSTLCQPPGARHWVASTRARCVMWRLPYSFRTARGTPSSGPPSCISPARIRAPASN